MRGTTFNYANREEDAPFAASTPSVTWKKRQEKKNERQHRRIHWEGVEIKENSNLNCLSKVPIYTIMIYPRRLAIYSSCLLFGVGCGSQVGMQHSMMIQ